MTATRLNTFTNDTNWIAISNRPIWYRKVGNIVFVVISSYSSYTVNAETSTTIAQIPTGYRPSMNIVVPLARLGGTGLTQMQVQTNGDIVLYSTVTTGYYAGLAVYPV